MDFLFALMAFSKVTSGCKSPPRLLSQRAGSTHSSEAP